jgi:anti-anti-sigma factor
MIDLSTVDQFRQAAAAAVTPGTDLTVDLSGCTFMGSEGIGILIDTVKALGSSDLILRSPSGIITKVLELSGLEKFPNVKVTAG